MLKLPICDECKNYKDDESADKCLAYPDGIPPEALYNAKEGCECMNGYGFKRKEILNTTNQ